MSRPIVLQDDFSRGAVQDLPRHRLPKNAVWNTTDWIPNVGDGSLRKRGGWTRPYNAMSATTSAYGAACGFAPFTTVTPKILGFDEDGRLYTWNVQTVTTTNVGAAYVPAHPPTFYREMSIICDPAGAAGPKKYPSTYTLAALGGSPPNASVSCVYKDHLVLANSAATPNRVWFSNAGDPEAWDTAANGQWLDCSAPVRGIATLRNMILVFEDGQVERIRGDVIPGVVGSDFVREPALTTIGCSDPASISINEDSVIFANGQGIFLTDGIGVVDLTRQCGMSSYWREKLRQYQSSYTIASAMWNGWYIFSVSEAQAEIVSGMIDVEKRVWVTLSNINASMIHASPPGVLSYGQTYRELYFSENAAPRVATLEGIFPRSSEAASGGPSQTYDGNDVDVTGSVEFGTFAGTPGIKRWQNLYVDYTLGNDFSETPYWTIAVDSAQHQGGYLSLSPTILTNQKAYGAGSNDPTLGGNRTIKRIPLNVAVQHARHGLSLKLTQTNRSLYSILWSLKADVREVEGSRVG